MRSIMPRTPHPQQVEESFYVYQTINFHASYLLEKYLTLNSLAKIIASHIKEDKIRH